MASRGLGYDYGTGGSSAGGKIRRRSASRAAASPYARPPPAPALAAATAASQGGGWFSRLISAGASRLLPSLFRKPPAQFAALPPPPEPLDATHSRPDASQESLLPQQDVVPAFLQAQPEPLNAPPSPPPPPLEDDLPEGEENGGAVPNIPATDSSAKDREDMLRNSDEHSVLDLEDLLKQRTFKRSEFEYLSELLWSRTVGSNSPKPDNINVKKMHVSEKETGSMRSNLPVDFSIGTYSLSDLVASPAEIAKAYMGSKSASGSSLRLRLHDPSSLTIKSIEANTIQQDRSTTIPLQGSRLHTSKNSDRFKSNFSTPNRSAICKMSSSPYFKNAASSDDLFSNVSSSYRTPSSVQTFGRQVLKRKSTAVNNEMVSVGSIRKMRQRYNRTSPLLETQPGYHGHLGSHRSKLHKDSQHSTQSQKRRCLSKVGDAALGGLDDKACASSFGQAPVQSAEMAAKILKQLDTLVPSQKEVTPEIKQKNEDVINLGTHVSHKKEVPVQSNLSEPSSSGVKSNSLLNGINGNVTFTSAQVTEKSVDAISNTSASLMNKSISQTTSQKDKPPTFSSRSHPPNLVLSSEVDRNKMPTASYGFTFPVPAVHGHTQAPPTPTMASPPILPIEKLQPTTSSASVTSVDSGPRIPKSVLEEESIAQKNDKQLNADDQLISSKSSGQVTSFTCNPVFKFPNSKLATLSNGLQHTVNSNGPTSKASSPSACSYTVSTNSTTVSVQNASTGGGFAISSSGTGTGPTAPSFMTGSLVSSGAGSGSVPFSSSPQFGAASSSVTQDKTKAVSSSAPYIFSPQFGTASSFAAQDKSVAASPEPTFFPGNHHAQPGNSNSIDSAHNLSFKPSEKPTGSNSQSLANSSVVSAHFGSTFGPSSLFSSAAGSRSASVTAAVSAFSPISSSATGSGTVFLASPVFGSKLTTTATPGFPNYGSATSHLSSAPNTVFSFTTATPSIQNSSPTTPIFGGVSPATGSTTRTGQMNGGNMITDGKESPFSTTLPFGIPSNSPSTPIFSSPATQFAPTTTPSPEIFKLGEQNASSGAFSIGSGGGNEKSGRKFIRVKRRK